MSECYDHEKLRRQGSPCPYCEIDRLWRYVLASETAWNNVNDYDDIGKGATDWYALTDARESLKLD